MPENTSFSPSELRSAKPPVDPQHGGTVVRPLVVYHAFCADGLSAAYAAWRHFGDAAEYLPRVHAQPLPDLTGRDVYMLDIAFSLSRMEEAHSQARSLVVLDHHQSAAQELRGWCCTKGHKLFDLNKSAARLAWGYFQPGQPLPPLFRFVEDRDLLRWALPDSQPYLAALEYLPRTMQEWDRLARMSPAEIEDFIDRGRVINEVLLAEARRLAEGARDIEMLGGRGRLVNAPDLSHTLVGEELLQPGVDFAMMWCLEGQGTRVKVGLRSKGAFDTTRIAEAFGGGGHPFASAFRLPLERLHELVSGRLTP